MLIAPIHEVTNKAAADKNKRFLFLQAVSMVTGFWLSCNTDVIPCVTIVCRRNQSMDVVIQWFGRHRAQSGYDAMESDSQVG